jgi:hypothetical protein|tara:strand:+ start:419 stop:673 length:255 start_codon:yes stop_codon:yes gene_type:complete
MGEVAPYTVSGTGKVLVAEISEEEATHISPEITLSPSGNMVMALGSASFFLSHDGAMCLADMLVEAAMLGEGVSSETFNEGTPQ